MARKIPALKPREIIRLLLAAGCTFYREGKGDHRLYSRVAADRKRIVPIDMGVGELSPLYVLRILRQFGFSDEEIEIFFR
ncbi:MAG TPA: type II toxin-antitoxin system HicA family toxin [Patescibacteria group bacterium]|nr:type II toxin-antitoxin system HicA family toxin [Patescibacteria group bacterium]